MSAEAQEKGTAMSEKNLKVAVVAANGRVGQLVVEEATRRGMDVTAVVRGENKTATEKSLVKDALELTAANLAGFDAVVDAAGGAGPRQGRADRTQGRGLLAVRG